MAGVSVSAPRRCCAPRSATAAAQRSARSSRRSRSGGSVAETTLSLKYRSSRKVPAATEALRSRCVAAITRASKRRGSESPTRTYSCSSRRRRSLPCASRGRSPTSSRKRVPLPAASTCPTRPRSAPVKAPFACPKSSLSTSEAATTAQLKVTRGRSRRGESAWMCLARKPFPVPVSPRRRIVASVAAARVATARHCCIAGLRVSKRARTPRPPARLSSASSC